MEIISIGIADEVHCILKIKQILELAQKKNPVGGMQP